MRSSRQTLAVAALLGATVVASAGIANATVALKLTSPTTTLAPGDTILIQAEVASKVGSEAAPGDTTFNAFDLVVRFDPAMVTFVPASPLSNQIGPLMSEACANLFHVFNATADSTVADLSLLCNQTFVTGPGTIYQLRFVSNGTSGVAKFSAGNGTRFLSAGVYLTPVLSQGVSLVVGNVLAAPGSGRKLPRKFILEAPSPNPWHGGASANVNFTSPKAARVDFALFDTLGRKVAGLSVGEAPAGRSSVRWPSPGLAAGRYELRLQVDGRVVARQPWVLLQ